jgi:hypothetical protein
MGARLFQINPGPLRTVPKSQRKPFAKPSDLANVGRCDAQLKNGSGRCLNDGRICLDGRWLCGIHAPSAEAEQ